MLDSLNPPQREAVEHTDGPLLILAGAGSGKTRVITSRIAHLVGSEGVDPDAILAVTFTNKAADEMEERVAELLSQTGKEDEASNTLISTFHSLGARLLRWHARGLGRDANFTILDQDDQMAMVREVADRVGFEADHSERKRLRRKIERMKNLGLAPKEAHERTEDREGEEDVEFYERYQEHLRAANVVDFGDLLLGPLQIFRSDAELARDYSRRWRYVMVDEFQDTNPAQYELLQHLTGVHRNLAVVGDDDQAIYRWRDATVENILGFEDDYPESRIVRLEQNYRSTRRILAAANDVIRENPHRREKTLWTDRQKGERPTIFTARTSREEAEFVADEMQRLVRQGAEYDDFAVFYRTNAQSRLFEEQLRSVGVPFCVVGGVGFYGREEVKDVLAYLQLALNPDDDVSFLRVVGTPTRGVGDKTVEKLRRAVEAAEVKCLFDAARYHSGWRGRAGVGLRRVEPGGTTAAAAEALKAVEEIGGRPAGGLAEFCALIIDLRERLAANEPLAELVEHLLGRINYVEWIEDRDPERAEEKRRNLGELVDALRDFENREEGSDDSVSIRDVPDASGFVTASDGGRRLQSFLERSTLVRDDSDEGERGRVTMMTVHSAKGLEFDTVFLAGMEDELFPNVRDEEPAEVHEERRLAYVAMTRAKNRLYLTNARRRRRYGETRRTRPSRFLLEIEDDHVDLDSRSCVDEIDYGRSRSSWRARREPSYEDAERNFRGDREWQFDQSVGRIEGGEGGGSSFDETETVSQLAPDERSSETSGAVDRSDRDTEHDLVGATVTHSRFGIGEVLAVTDEGSRTRLTVQFPTGGEQTVYRRFVKVV